ncbi:MAG: penicillin-binding protein activator LpoB [Marinobacter sp.]|nr:penicillin-binding protein activator LpoB [Marinobacter sp.]
MSFRTTSAALVAASLLVTGCATSEIENVRGTPTVYQDPSTAGRVGGVGIQSQDIIAVTDQMMRDLMATPAIVGRSTPPRILISDQYIQNQSTSVINVRMFSDRLRTELNRAAQGRVVFVARDYAAAIQQERDLKRDGVVDGGTIRATQATAGVDYQMFGTITSADAIDRSTGMQERYTMINFELVDMELGTIVWADLYEMSKASQDNVLYR